MGVISVSLALMLLASDAFAARVLSLNVAAEKDAGRIERELRARTGIPDILLLQEVRKLRGSELSVAEELARRIGYHAVFAAPNPGPTNIGVAIVSRWPMRDKQVRRVQRFYKVLRFRPRIAIAATADTPFGPIRIWNTHLDTRINVEERLQQLRPLVTEASAFAGPCIFGGDLNTNRAKWLLHAIPVPAGPVHARAVAEFMAKHGFHTPFQGNRPTFDLFNLQLDWVFARGIKTGNTGIEPLEFSDHHAIWAEIAVN